MKRAAFATAFAFGIVLALGCGTDEKPTPEIEEYFPLAVGDWWLFNETDNDPDTDWGMRPIRYDVVDYIDMDFDYDTEGALSVFVIENTFPTNEGDDDPRLEYIQDDGVRSVRKRQEVYDGSIPGDLNTARDYEPGLLRFDRGQVTVGDEWDEDYEFYVQDQDGIPFQVWEVEYLYRVLEPKTVTVPAGTFDCMVLERTCQSGLPCGDSPEVKIYYFAPDVGKVKEETTPKPGLYKIEELVEYHIESLDGGVDGGV